MMGIGAQETTTASSFEARLGHVQRGERRVAEMECHVRSLRDKLDRLEKMLLSSEECDPCEPSRIRDQATCDVTVGDRTKGSPEVCPIDEMAKREKCLRKQIYDMECTEKDYMRRIVELKKIEKNSTIKKKERLSLLESYSQKLCNNLQCLEKNHVGLTQEAQNLSQVLEKTSMNSPDKEKKCSCKLPAKCNSCIICTCDEWKRDLETGDDTECSIQDECPNEILPPPKSDRCRIKKELPRKREKCSCFEMMSSSSDSDDEYICGCLRVQQKQSTKVGRCNCNDVDTESVSTSCSSDSKTVYSEMSKFTCFCSKVHSHEDLLTESDNDVCDEKVFVNQDCTKTERFRGGRDRIDTSTAVVSCVEKNISADSTTQSTDFPSFQNVIMNHLKLMKVEEIREGLERLKIRNRNLKDFLQSLENPFNLMTKPSETAASSACTQVSSCYTLNVAKQTRSGLLAAVNILESKCRNKDHIIGALADELKTTGSKKLYRVRGKEPGSEVAKIWKTLSDKKRKSIRRFTKKDSALGFLIFLMILLSHAKRSEMLSYFQSSRKILTESKFQLILLINESKRFLLNLLTLFCTAVENFTENTMKNVINRWEVINSWLVATYETTSVQINNRTSSTITYLVANQYYVISFTSLILTMALMMRFRKIIVNHIRVPNYTMQVANIVKSFERIKLAIATIIRIFCERVLSSKIFWLILGFCSHVLWNFVSDDIFRLIGSFSDYLYNTDNVELSTSSRETMNLLEITDEEKQQQPVCRLFDELDYCWILSMFGAQFQSLVEFSYYVLKNVIV